MFVWEPNPLSKNVQQCEFLTSRSWERKWVLNQYRL